MFSEKQVFGTNMLGFKQDIANSDTLSVFFDFISLGSVLTNTDADY